jgi:hypothetical protein
MLEAEKRQVAREPNSCGLLCCDPVAMIATLIACLSLTVKIMQECAPQRSWLVYRIPRHARTVPAVTSALSWNFGNQTTNWRGSWQSPWRSGSSLAGGFSERLESFALDSVLSDVNPQHTHPHIFFKRSTSVLSYCVTPLGTKRPWREANHSPQSSAEIENSWSYPSTASYVWMVWYDSDEHEGQPNLTFYRFKYYSLICFNKISN